MKKFRFLALAFLVSIALDVSLSAQTVTTASTVGSSSSRSYGGSSTIEIGGTLRGAPCSLVKKTTTVKILADGTTLTNGHEERFYRDFEGRTRTDRVRTVLHGEEQLEVITVRDPVANIRIQLFPKSKEATISRLPEQRPRTASEDEAKAERIAEIEAEREARMTQDQRDATYGVEIGRKDIAGMSTEGRRFTRTIPAGERGNDRELQIVTESWVSPDLKIEMEFTSENAMDGKTDSLVTDLQLRAPDPALFKVPDDYMVVERDEVSSGALHE